MSDDPGTSPDTDLPATPADAVTHPEQPPMDDDTPDAEVEDEAAKLGDFALRAAMLWQAARDPL